MLMLLLPMLVNLHPAQACCESARAEVQPLTVCRLVFMRGVLSPAFLDHVTENSLVKIQ